MSTCCIHIPGTRKPYSGVSREVSVKIQAESQQEYEVWHRKSLRGSLQNKVMFNKSTGSCVLKLWHPFNKTIPGKCYLLQQGDTHVIDRQAQIELQISFI